MTDNLRHERKCDGIVKYKYPGGVYKNTPFIFEELEAFGIVVPDDKRFEKYFAVFDFEAFQRDFNKDTDQEQDELGEDTTWNKIHIPVSYSVGSNVLGAEEIKHYASEDPRDLVDHFVKTLKAIAHAREQIMLDQFKGVFTEIEDTFNSMVLIEREDEADDGLDVLLDDIEEEEEEEEEEDGIDLVEGNEEEKEEEEEIDEMKRLASARLL